MNRRPRHYRRNPKITDFSEINRKMVEVFGKNPSESSREHSYSANSDASATHVPETEKNAQEGL